MRKYLWAALSVATATIATGAIAQPYYQGDGQQPYHQGYQQPEYGRHDGDYGRRRHTQYGSYPQFRGIEAHIRQEIVEGVREDLIQRDDARDLLSQLRQIQADESREFRVHGWNLPEDDQQRIREQLQQLDSLVDQTRAEQ